MNNNLPEDIFWLSMLAAIVFVILLQITNLQ
jgi:hypothetical protein